MISADRIAETRRKIAERFIHQCVEGAQSKVLPGEMSACGQHLGDPDNQQRGLHGTAAALSVVAQGRDTLSRGLAAGLVDYVRERREAELSQALNPRDVVRITAHLDRDERNVVKIAEVVFALSRVERGAVPTEATIQPLRDALENGRAESRGWGYFLGSPSLDVIPTAFAVRALASLGIVRPEPIEFLLTVAEAKAPVQAIPEGDIFAQVLALYVLVFSRSDGHLVNDRPRLVRAFDELWSRLEGLFGFDLEANIEYQDRADHHYVRIPWQLYMLAMAAELRPLFRLAGVTAQRRIDAIDAAARSPVGFVYPHSGKVASARTNGILYEAFAFVESGLRKNVAWHWPFYAFDAIRRVATSRAVVRSARVIALVFIVYSVYHWLANLGDLKDVAPNFVAAAALAVLALQRSRYR